MIDLSTNNEKDDNLHPLNEILNRNFNMEQDDALSNSNLRVPKPSSKFVKVNQKEIINSIWENHLHFPRIENLKLTKKGPIPVFAITSKQWK